MLRKTYATLIALLVVSALILSACTGQKTQPNQPAPTAPKAAAVGGEVIYDVPADPDSFAPFWYTSAYAATVTDKVYGGGLLRIGFDLKPEPNLAEAMPTVSADSKTYTFKVKKGVKFHDGKPVTAHDIAFSYEVLMHADYKGSWKGTYVTGPGLESVKALDDSTIEFKTKDVFAPFLFGAASLHPLPKHLVGSIPVKDMATWDGWKKPIGAGPYKFVEWKSGQYTLLERNADFWEAGKTGAKNGLIGPFVEKIRVKVIPETNTAIAALEAGELTYKGSVEPSHVDRIKNEKKDKLNAFDWDRMGYGYQTFNNDKWPTNVLEVRQALSYGLNRDAIIKGVMENKATKPAGFVPPIHWVFNKSLKGYDYDVKKAEELLAKAGFKKNAKGILEKDGKELKLQYVATKGSPIIDGVALQSQKDWKALGVELELIMVDFNTLLDKHLKPGDFHITFSGLGFSVDPHFSFDLWHSRNIILDAKGVNQGGNRARYKNTAVDKLIEEGKVTVDPAKRLAIYQQAEQLIMNDAPANFIYVNQWTDFVKKDVKGVVNWNGYGVSYLNQWYLNEK